MAIVLNLSLDLLVIIFQDQSCQGGTLLATREKAKEGKLQLPINLDYLFTQPTENGEILWINSTAGHITSCRKRRTSRLPNS
jgi:hypothetical protein